jgi:hypothetical protein
MVVFMKANGSKINVMEKVYRNTLTVVFTKAIGRMINAMDTVN